MKLPTVLFVSMFLGLVAASPSAAQEAGPCDFTVSPFSGDRHHLQYTINLSCPVASFVKIEVEHELYRPGLSASGWGPFEFNIGRGDYTYKWENNHVLHVDPIVVKGTLDVACSSREDTTVRLVARISVSGHQYDWTYLDPQTFHCS
jgi:hypothetical protein